MPSLEDRPQHLVDREAKTKLSLSTLVGEDEDSVVASNLEEVQEADLVEEETVDWVSVEDLLAEVAKLRIPANASSVVVLTTGATDAHSGTSSAAVEDLMLREAGEDQSHLARLCTWHWVQMPLMMTCRRHPQRPRILVPRETRSAHSWPPRSCGAE